MRPFALISERRTALANNTLQRTGLALLAPGR